MAYSSYWQVGACYAGYNETKTYNRSTRKHRSLKFVGPVLYSYETPIARYIKDATILLVNDRPFSMTTRTHKNEGLGCVKAKRFDVMSIGCSGGWTRGDFDVDHQKNLEYMWSQVQELAEKAIRLYRKEDHSWPIYQWPRRLDNALHEMLAYQQMVGGDIRKACDFPTDIAEWIEKIHSIRREKLAVFNEPKAVERRERAKARRMMKAALNLEAA